MGRILFWAIALYSLFLVCYFIWERWDMRRRRRGKAPFQPEVVEDIMGKSGFDIRNSTPQATTLIQSEKRVENDSTFAAVNGETPAPRPPAAIPDERLDEVFATGTPGVDIVIDNRPDNDADGDDGIIDREEQDDDDETAQSAPRRKMATGLRFDELKSMVRTVNAPDAATDAERLDAGRVLVEVRQTDMFEQVISGQPVKRVTVGQLIDDYLAAFYRDEREAGESNDAPEGGYDMEALKNFDVRAYSRKKRNN